ncbi:WD40/YVTN/BNR-like repeat-containing protein [Spectribacter hydrogenooxidans]|uniref:YCF48-related protein n=1 Tax=Spectribacter hydrogenoxidans TaxID=3075608 RepID=A0ABU3C394_9GAMM|nr:YCF48-related protein [Salinisphaera sp. W335]MDT0636033.1 YCF48-related protein [Salinisphaera sp. W335]
MSRSGPPVSKRRQCLALCGLLLAAASGHVAMAQDEEASEAPEAKPAEMAPLAPYELLLDVERRGDGFVAVGVRGHALTSEDGINWTQAEVPVRATLTAVDFVDDKRGWAVGHAATILATNDGGETWTLQNFEPSLETPFLDVLFTDAQTGFAIGAYDLFYKTQDGGETWTEYEPQLSMGGWHLNSIVALDDGTLVIAGETGLLSKSTDGGETWDLIEAPYSGTFFGIRQLGPQGLLLFGLRGHAFVTDDVASLPVLPPDTDLGYQFKLPPSMEKGNEEEGTEAEEEALAEAERKAAEEKAAESDWDVVDNDKSVLSLFGGTQTADGGYVLVGVNGRMWLSDDRGPKTRQLPNPREGGLTDVVETANGDLLFVGENGAFLYKRNR